MKNLLKSAVWVIALTLSFFLNLSPGASANPIDPSLENALTSYLDALKAGQIEQAATFDCWGHVPSKMPKVSSWRVNQASEDTWQVLIESVDRTIDPPKIVATDWNFQVVKSSVFRAEMASFLDNNVNRWAKHANKLARAVGIGLKDPEPLKPEDFFSLSHEPFCISNHSQVVARKADD